MAVAPRVSGSAVVELFRAGSPFSVRVPTRSYGVSSSPSATRSNSSQLEGLSCVFVGKIETASQETLEALYCQARDAYYSGEPLIVDDMFDRVELKLRWYGSKYVIKYPRCSLRRQSTYADAKGRKILHKFLHWQAYGISPADQASAVEFLAPLNGILFMLGFVIGYPIASASVGALQGLWKNDLVALKGACPNCTEEVFAFVRSDQPNQSSHRAECHICESSLEFRTKVEQSISRPGSRWVHGRIYLIRPKSRY
ncbi:uncharacterized protein [Primulina huaijiensis]|uniref:uncharacterized protein isoform X3 n=1 Tax=Primulina huaijiensis TaxID=1492673 RepID=UPI003CC738C2